MGRAARATRTPRDNSPRHRASLRESPPAYAFRSAERRAATGNVGPIVSTQTSQAETDSLAGLRGLELGNVVLRFAI